MHKVCRSMNPACSPNPWAVTMGCQGTSYDNSASAPPWHCIANLGRPGHAMGATRDVGTSPFYALDRALDTYRRRLLLSRSTAKRHLDG